MSDPDMIEGIKAAVTIPVMAKARIGHFVEAQILQVREWQHSLVSAAPGLEGCDVPAAGALATGSHHARGVGEASSPLVRTCVLG